MSTQQRAAADWSSLRLPVIAAPMFLVTNPDLVISTVQAGILGSVPALNFRTTEGFEAALSEIVEAIPSGPRRSPFGVNLVVHSSNPRLEDDLSVITAHRVPLVITSLGLSGNVVDEVHRYGGVVFHDVTNRAHAERAVERGADGLILVCAGAGGHAGTLNPFAFIAEVRTFFDGPLVLSGCITSGRDVASAIMMGADFAYMGTRFIATAESMASDAYKAMIVEARANDVVYTSGVSGMPASFLSASIAKTGFELKTVAPDDKPDITELTRPYERRASDGNEPKPWRDVWSAGQGSAGITDIPSASELVNRIDDEYREAIGRFRDRFQDFGATWSPVGASADG